MYIESLQLKNFRNYESLMFRPSPGINVIYGDNAQGKTNILEAMYLAGTSKSHRGSRDSEMIRFGEREAHIRMFLNKKGISRKIDMHLRKGKSKGAAIDGIPVRKSAELLALTDMIFFSPEDLNIIKSGPKERRRFLDAISSDLDPFYLPVLLSYQKVVLQRNRLLKELPRNRSLEPTLDVWDAQLLRFGKKLIRSRKETISMLNRFVGKIHENLTGGKEKLLLTYEPNTEEQDFERLLKKNRERDRRFATSSTGPHRDDFKVRVNEMDVRQYGSQGQQRSAALSLKLSEIKMMEEKSHESPVLLLDDVLSELDSDRQKYLLQNIGSVQTFITCTGMEDLLNHNFPIDYAVQVKDGHFLF